MISGFAVILNEDIVFCSEEKDVKGSKYPLFETILFIEKLMKSISNKWRLDSIFFERDGIEERIIIKHIITKNGDNIFFCISGGFNPKSKESYRMLDEFYRKVKSYYPTTEDMRDPEKLDIIDSVIGTKAEFLKLKYSDKLKSEEIMQRMDSRQPSYEIDNRILYTGIATQGLPLISKLYYVDMFDYLKNNENEEMAEVFCSKLSAKLATIEMNTNIRAETNIKRIFIKDLREESHKVIILFGKIHNFSLDFIGFGTFNQIHRMFLKLKNELSKEKILKKEFIGKLQPYKHISRYLEELTAFICPREDLTNVKWSEDCITCIYHKGNHRGNIE
ncbi:MAG: hypothetical protein EU541_01565, partial [Promethearchaeota archaeon]